MESRTSRHSIREFVDSLRPGSRVVWIANGALGTVQPDRSILWDDGHHMTHKQMNDTHALLIHSEAEKKQLQEGIAHRLRCLKLGCTLVRWDAKQCKEGLPEKFCPLALLTEAENHSIAGRPKRRSIATPASNT